MREWVAVNILNDEFIIKISDNGRGFDTIEKAQGIGISNGFKAKGLGVPLSINGVPGLGFVLIGKDKS
jgi:signal transduction histidine kinase